MGSINSSSINIVPKQSLSYRNIGRAITITSGVIPNGEQNNVLDTPPTARTADELGDQVSISGVQQTTVDYSSTQKTTESIEDSIIVRDFNTSVVDSTAQEEIALRPVSQRGTRHTGNRVVIHNSEEDSLVSRQGN